MPLLPSSVSLPSPPSTVIAISAARLPVALNESSPPLALSDEASRRCPMSTAERRRGHTVEAHAGAVGGARELLGAVAAVHLRRVDAVAAFVEVGVVAGVPDHAVVARLAEGLVVGVAAR